MVPASAPRSAEEPILPRRLAARVLAGSVAAWLAAGALLGCHRATGTAAPTAVRVGASGDYAPFSVASPDGKDLRGFDVAVARAYARDRRLALEFVRFRWDELLPALDARRFDVAMSGVTVRPERSAAGRFTVAVAETGAVVLVRDPRARPDLRALDDPRVRIGVNAGGHLERVTRGRFRHAIVVAIRDNAAVRRALIDGRIDAAVTDTLEAPLWMRHRAPHERTEGWKVLGPLTRDRKAYLVRADRPDLAHDLDEWLLERERDGTLARLRGEHFGPLHTAGTATPVHALVAAIDERLSLMPAVAGAKAAAGSPVDTPERELLVMAATRAAVADAAATHGRGPPSDDAIDRLSRVLIEAAKDVQRAALADPAPRTAGPSPDLATMLRPALLRIGDRIAHLVVSLPASIDRATIADAVRDGLRAHPLSEARRRDLIAAIAGLRPPRAEETRPAGTTRRRPRGVRTLHPAARPTRGLECR
jgi:cyclohexadienyl dehydratase